MADGDEWVDRVIRVSCHTPVLNCTKLLSGEFSTHVNSFGYPDAVRWFACWVNLCTAIVTARGSCPV